MTESVPSTILVSPPKRARGIYPWSQHARFLRDHPNRWVMLEPSLAAGQVGYIRDGNQPELAKLQPHLQTKAVLTHPDPVTGHKRFELWARYLPDLDEVPPLSRVHSDEFIRELRERFAKDRSLTLAKLSQETGINQTTIRSWLLGRSRRKAGGPLSRNTDRGRRRRKS